MNSEIVVNAAVERCRGDEAIQFGNCATSATMEVAPASPALLA